MERPLAVDELSREAIAALDHEDMLSYVLDQPAQLGDAMWRVESAMLDERDEPNGLLVCGMGGSAIGADLAAAAIGDRATRPIRSVRDYAPEPWLSSEMLVLCASYSGDTEETLACYDAASAAAAPRIVVTTGGALADAARRDGVPVIGLPAGMRARAAVAYMTVAALECAALCGAAPSLRTEVDAAAALLTELAEEWGPDAPEDSFAKSLARRLIDAIPIVHGADVTHGVAWRWKSQFNENVNVPAYSARLPEANHNEVCGYERAGELGPFFAIFLEDSDQHPRVRYRMELTCRLSAQGTRGSERIFSRGTTRLERVMSLVFLGDLVSVYLAVLSGVDPTPVPAIDRFKYEMEQPRRTPEGPTPDSPEP
jgi:glucose/mannose-6-phosphate isomerase